MLGNQHVKHHIQSVSKRMLHKELRLLGRVRDPLKLTIGLNTPIYETKVCLGAIETRTLPYILSYSPYTTTVGTPVSHFILNISLRVRNRSAYCCLVGTIEDTMYGRVCSSIVSRHTLVSYIGVLSLRVSFKSKLPL